jgi:hypothetical protein
VQRFLNLIGTSPKNGNFLSLCGALEMPNSMSADLLFLVHTFTFKVVSHPCATEIELLLLVRLLRCREDGGVDDTSTVLGVVFT